VLRINLFDYGIDPKVYDRLANREPYFTVRIDVTYSTPAQPAVPPSQGQWNGREWLGQTAGRPAVEGSTRVERKNASAPWLDAAQAKLLVERTQSPAPLVRGDWFLYQTAIVEDRDPSYYDFLGLKNGKDFEELVGANRKLAEKRQWLLFGAVAQSGVAINNRAIERENAQAGGLWRTDDFGTSVDRQNVLRVDAGNTHPPHGDANELYSVLPNKLPVVFLQNAEGVAQKSVPPNIAPKDASANPNAKDCRIHPHKSCTTCHVEILRPIDEWVRETYRYPSEKLFAAPRLELRSPSIEKFRELRDTYFVNLKRQLTLDRLLYEGAIMECNGLSPGENARQFGAAWDWYAEPANVTPAQAAKELGFTEEAFMGKLRAYAAANGFTDPVLFGNYLHDPPVPIRREHLEEVVGLIYKVMGVVP
jgi:hypothetical protein